MSTNQLLNKRTRHLLVLFYLIGFAVIAPLLCWWVFQPAHKTLQGNALSQSVSPIQR